MQLCSKSVIDAVMREEQVLKTKMDTQLAFASGFELVQPEL